jgi:tRNA modification GTPase
MYEHDTIVASATAPGTGAVAIVRLSGSQALVIARRIWRPTRASVPRRRRMYLGEILDPSRGGVIDQALAVFMPGPGSLTGEDVAELHCHGGPYIVRRVLGLALDQGARLAQPGEFSRRAFLNGRMDLTAAEAVADLVAARSDAGLAQALAQLNGALRQRVSGLRDQLIAVRAHLEAEIDFADEDIALPSRHSLAQAVARLTTDVIQLRDSFARGRLARSGARAAIVGRPNVGKSSILNMLLGVERAIVTPVPGTTRDIIEDTLPVPPYALALQDTAGLHHGADQVESIGIERALAEAQTADLLVAVFDGSTPLAAEDYRVIELCRGRAGVALLNKNDLPRVTSAGDLRARGLELPVIAVSALHGEGVETIREHLREAIAGLSEAGSEERTAISRERHRDALARAATALGEAEAGLLAGMPPEIVAVDVTAGAEALGSISGEVSSEDVLDAIFREFCIGK